MTTKFKEYHGWYSFCFPWVHRRSDRSVNKKYSQMHCRNRLMDSGSSKAGKGNYSPCFRLRDTRSSLLKHKAVLWKLEWLNTAST